MLHGVAATLREPGPGTVQGPPGSAPVQGCEVDGRDSSSLPLWRPPGTPLGPHSLVCSRVHAAWVEIQLSNITALVSSKCGSHPGPPASTPSSRSRVQGSSFL